MRMSALGQSYFSSFDFVLSADITVAHVHDSLLHEQRNDKLSRTNISTNQSLT